MAVIFYFSGTGNSLYTAKCIAQGLKDCRIERMTEYIKSPYKVEDDIVGFVCPVYCFALPPYLHKFFDIIDAEPNYCFGVVTMGGNQGRALLELKERLSKKNITLNYAKTVVMPDNFFVKENKECLSKLEAAQPVIDEISQSIALGKQDCTEVKEALFWKKLGTSVGWWFMRDVLRIDQVFEYSTRCVGCGICAQVCPTGNIKMKGKKPNFYFECANCFACKHWCPQHAIRVGGMKSQLDKSYTNPFISLKEMTNR